MDRAAGSEELWRLTVEHSPIGMAQVATDGRLLVVNRAMCAMLGYEPEELTEKRFHDITYPEDHEPGRTMFRRTIDGEIDSFRLRKRYLRSDDSVMWGDLSVALVKEDDGTPLHLVAQLLDVTEEHVKEERLAATHRELERERRTLAAIFDTVDIGLLLIDRDGNYERMNRRHAETMGLPFPDGHHGKAGQLGEVFALDGRTRLTREEMPSYRASQGEEFDDVRFWVGADPVTRAAYTVSARSVRHRDGELAGAVLAYKDVTDLMRALQAKDDFVASVSHELRTPLTSVLAHLELLLDRVDLPHGVSGQLEVIERNAERLRALVSDLLHVAQSGDGGLQVQRQEVDVVALVRETTGAARPYAADAGVALEVDAPAGLVAAVDPSRLRQVIDHLVSNGIKYSEAGDRVTVTLRRDRHRVRLTVTDTGLGLEPDEAERVFNRFYRGTAAQERHIPGTGLGLHIVSAIVAAHGGEVTLDTKPGEGSSFAVTLPHAVV